MPQRRNRPQMYELSLAMMLSTSFSQVQLRNYALNKSVTASTVHKMQRSTVDYAVVYLGLGLFVSGEAYVAVSRVRSLDGQNIHDRGSAMKMRKYL